MLFCSRVTSRTRDHQLSHLLRSSVAVRPLSQTFLVYEDLDSVEEDGRGHCRTRSIGVRLLFLTIRLGLWAWGRKSAILLLSSRGHALSTGFMTTDAARDHPAQVCPASPQ